MLHNKTVAAESGKSFTDRRSRTLSRLREGAHVHNRPMTDYSAGLDGRQRWRVWPGSTTNATPAEADGSCERSAACRDTAKEHLNEIQLHPYDIEHRPFDLVVHCTARRRCLSNPPQCVSPPDRSGELRRSLGVCEVSSVANLMSSYPQNARVRFKIPIRGEHGVTATRGHRANEEVRIGGLHAFAATLVEELGS
jgi:hypothetical protein